jgi:hypothetical protein
VFDEQPIGALKANHRPCNALPNIS